MSTQTLDDYGWERKHIHDHDLEVVRVQNPNTLVSASPTFLHYHQLSRRFTSLGDNILS